MFKNFRKPNLAGLADDVLRAKAGKTNPYVNAYAGGNFAVGGYNGDIQRSCGYD